MFLVAEWYIYSCVKIHILEFMDSYSKTWAIRGLQITTL